MDSSGDVPKQLKEDTSCHQMQIKRLLSNMIGDEDHLIPS